MIYYLITIVVAYLLGSIPTAVWVGKTWHGIDIREHGSKNAGATNTFRVLGKKAGIAVLSIDVSKGVLAVLIPVLIFPLFDTISETQLDRFQISAAVFAVVGHIFPLFANFQGGKGVATSLGIVLGIEPLSATICLLIFLIVFILSKYVSLGSIIASFCFPICVCFLKPHNLELKIFSLVLGALVIFAHRKNIRRLLNHEEGKMNLFKK
ncbi:MAG: glycerol-3-phosphate 1-O-acyltransferase PlsY [Bacteroidota bacterium]